VIQVGATLALGAPIQAGLAALLAACPALLFAGRMSRLIGWIFPKKETSSISRRSYGRRRGVITVGTVRPGHPAQARFTDGHGNMHFTMVEPFEADDPLPQGTEIQIVKMRDGTLKAIRLSE